MAVAMDDMDGLGFDLGTWRFNLRSSNTEPVVRLNVETRGDPDLLAQEVDRLRAVLTSKPSQTMLKAPL